MNTKIFAVLMATIMATALFVPMAMSNPGPEHTSANVINACPEIEGITITPDDDPGATGVQVTPNSCAVGVKTVTVTVDVSDGNGYEDIDSVEIIDIAPDPASGDPSPVALAYVVGSGLGTDATYEGTFDMDCCDESQTYTVTVEVNDGLCIDDDPTADFFYESITILCIDFSAINYGDVEPCVVSYVIGDNDMTTPEYPTIHNCGNDPMQIEIHVTEMTPGVAYDPANLGNVDMNLDAQVPGDGVGNPTDPSEIYLPPCLYVPFPHVFLCCEETAIDFSIHVPLGTPTGQYTGILDICMY